MLDCLFYVCIAGCSAWRAKGKNLFGGYFLIYLALDQEQYLHEEKC